MCDIATPIGSDIIAGKRALLAHAIATFYRRLDHINDGYSSSRYERQQARDIAFEQLEGQIANLRNMLPPGMPLGEYLEHHAKWPQLTTDESS